jgi:glycine/serine hydroxymethyltransferase
MVRHVELKPSSGMQATQYSLRADIDQPGQVVRVLFRNGGFTTGNCPMPYSHYGMAFVRAYSVWT